MLPDFVPFFCSDSIQVILSEIECVGLPEPSFEQRWTRVIEHWSNVDHQLKRKYKYGCDLETLNSGRAQTHDSSASRDNCTATTFWRAIP